MYKNVKKGEFMMSIIDCRYVNCRYVDLKPIYLHVQIGLKLVLIRLICLLNEGLFIMGSSDIPHNDH